MSNLTLYDLEKGLVDLYVEMEEAIEGNDQEAIERLGEAMEVYVQGAVDKRDKCAKFIKSLESLEEALTKERHALMCRKNKITLARDKFEEYILRIMDMAGKDRIDGGVFSFVKKKNPPSVKIAPDATLRGDYIKQQISYSPDKKMIARDIKIGIDVEGASLECGHRLEIK